MHSGDPIVHMLCHSKLVKVHQEVFREAVDDAVLEAELVAVHRPAQLVG